MRRNATQPNIQHRHGRGSMTQVCRAQILMLTGCRSETPEKHLRAGGEQGEVSFPASQKVTLHGCLSSPFPLPHEEACQRKIFKWMVGGFCYKRTLLDFFLDSRAASLRIWFSINQSGSMATKSLSRLHFKKWERR